MIILYIAVFLAGFMPSLSMTVAGQEIPPLPTASDTSYVQSAAPELSNENPPMLASRLPSYVSLLPNINDFWRFADGGPDGNWYVGFNNAWIVKLPPVSMGNYTRAFIGAKLGRAKTQAKAGNPWEREAIPGKIYMAISQTPAFSSEQSFFLADAEDIPLEPNPRIYIRGPGASEWFWTEVPIGLVSTREPNYLVVWSPTENFTDATAAPILAAGEIRSNHGPAQAWLNRKIQGVPPRITDGSLETPINNPSPAVAIKLIPINDAEVGVNECSVVPSEPNYIFQFTVDAENAERAWVESSKDQLEWRRISGYFRHPPYSLTISPDHLFPRGTYIRAVAEDSLGNVGNCDPVFLSRSAH